VKEKPIMGLKSQKNYVTSNAIDNILMEPRKRKIPNDKDLDYYMNKKDYGRVPNYIRRAQSANQRNLDQKLRVQNENERYQNRMRKTLDNEELTLLREGLTKKLDSLQKEYGRISHRNKFDTLVARNYKENLEKEMEQVQKDLDSINKDIVTVQDYGQGFIPNSFRDDGKTIFEAAFSVLNTSGKYREDGTYEGTSLGSFGIGSKITTFLSHWLTVLTRRDGKFEQIK